MSRPLPGAFYHVTSRGNVRKEIFCVVFEYEKGWHKNGGPKMTLKSKLRSFIRLRRKSQTLPVDEFTAAWVKPCPYIIPRHQD